MRGHAQESWDPTMIPTSAGHVDVFVQVDAYAIQYGQQATRFGDDDSG